MATLAYSVRRSGVPAYISTSLIESTPAFQIITFIRHSATEPAVDFCANHVIRIAAPPVWNSLSIAKLKLLITLMLLNLNINSYFFHIKVTTSRTVYSSSKYDSSYMYDTDAL